MGKFNSVAILPVVAMASSVSAIAAQNIAARLPDRALRVMRDGIGISLTVGVLVFVLSQFCAEPILRLFKSDDEKVIELGARYLRAFCFDYLFVSFLFNMNSLINAAGHALFSMISSMLPAIILRGLPLHRARRIRVRHGSHARHHLVSFLEPRPHRVLLQR